jgi:hypothetical protein
MLGLESNDFLFQLWYYTDCTCFLRCPPQNIQFYRQHSMPDQRFARPMINSLFSFFYNKQYKTKPQLILHAVKFRLPWNIVQILETNHRFVLRHTEFPTTGINNRNGLKSWKKIVSVRELSAMLYPKHLSGCVIVRQWRRSLRQNWRVSTYYC